MLLTRPRCSWIPPVILGTCVSLIVARPVQGACRPCRRHDEINITAVAHGDWFNPGFWGSAYKGIEYAQEVYGIQVAAVDNINNDYAAIAQLIESNALVSDYLSTTVIENVTIGDAVRRVAAAGRFVITFNAGWGYFPSLGAAQNHIGQDDYDSGYQSGVYMATSGVKLGLCIDHEPGDTAAASRCQGYRDGMRHLNASVLPDLFVDETQATSGQAALQQIVNQNPSLAGIFTLNTAVAASVVAMNLPKRVGTTGIMLGTSDVDARSIQAVINGQLAFIIDQQEFMQTFLPTQLFMLDYMAGVRVSSSYLKSGPSFITRENVIEYNCLTNSSATGCPPQSAELNISLVSYANWYEDEFTVQLRYGAEQAAADHGLPSTSLHFLSTKNFDLVASTSLLSAAVSTSGAVAVVAPALSAVLPGLVSAATLNVPVVTIGDGGSLFDFSSLNMSARPLLHFGLDEYNVGYGLGQSMAQAGVKIGLCLLHTLGNDALTRYCDGFQHGLQSLNGQIQLISGSNYIVVSSLNQPAALSQLGIAFTTTRADGWLFLSGVVGEWALHFLSSPSANPARIITLAGVGHSPVLKAAVGKGVSSLVAPQPYLQGYLAVSHLFTFRKTGYALRNGLVQTNVTFGSDAAGMKAMEQAKCWPTVAGVDPGAVCPACPGGNTTRSACNRNGVCNGFGAPAHTVAMTDDGTCTCRSGWLGADCGEVDTGPRFVSFTSSYGIAFMTLAAAGTVTTLLVMVTVVMNRHAKVVKAGGIIFSLISLTGIALGFSTLFAFTGFPTPSACVFRVVGSSIAHSLVVGPIIAHLARLYIIFSRRTLTTLSLKDDRLIVFALIPSLINIALFITWFVIDVPRASAVQTPSGEYHYTCTTGKAGEAVQTAMWSYNGAMIIVGVVLAFLTRGVKVGQNDSRSVLRAMTLLALLFFVLPTAIYLSGSNSSITYILTSLLLLLTPAAFLYYIYWPKIIRVFSHSISNAGLNGCTGDDGGSTGKADSVYGSTQSGLNGAGGGAKAWCRKQVMEMRGDMFYVKVVRGKMQSLSALWELSIVNLFVGTPVNMLTMVAPTENEEFPAMQTCVDLNLTSVKLEVGPANCICAISAPGLSVHIQIPADKMADWGSIFRTLEARKAAISTF
ncbi:hypothetical protein HK101_009300 [Irineochytrium annulatum]|nr:hypothetical protein HK101_009300 [Irineochytrium annulatum]